MDYDEILRATHTMKGIASNLEFTQLQQKSAKAVDMIRAGEKETVLPVIDEIEKEYQKVVDAIQKLDKLDNVEKIIRNLKNLVLK